MSCLWLTPEKALRLRDALITLCAKEIDGASKAESERLSKQFKTAPVVIWDEELYRAAVNGSEAFKEIAQADITKPVSQFWLVQKGTGISCLLFEIRYDEGGPKVQIIPYGARSAPIRDELYYVKPTGDECLLLNEDLSAEADRMGRFVPEYLAAFCFMRQEFIAVEDQQLPRSIRRAAELGRRPPLPDIRVVSLRRVAREHQHDSVSTREWSCQWMVRGHWVSPHHRMKEQRPYYRRPHIKGPPTKEFRAPRETVYKVRQ